MKIVYFLMTFLYYFFLISIVNTKVIVRQLVYGGAHVTKEKSNKSRVELI